MSFATGMSKSIEPILSVVSVFTQECNARAPQFFVSTEEKNPTANNPNILPKETGKENLFSNISHHFDFCLCRTPITSIDKIYMDAVVFKSIPLYSINFYFGRIIDIFVQPFVSSELMWRSEINVVRDF